MAENIDHDYEKGAPTSVRGSIGEDVALGIDDLGAIPKGTIDPVYEAKARVLNRAVCDEQEHPTITPTDNQ